VKRGVDVDRRCGKENSTALMRATWIADDDACVKRLLKAGANPNLEFGPFDKVMMSMNEEMEELIEKAKKKWNRTNATKKKAAKKKPAKKKR
jgi:hypothetical protein